MKAFRTYSKHHQMLMMPVCAIQNQLRRSTLGGSVWSRVAGRQIELYKGKAMPIRELMVLVSPICIS